MKNILITGATGNLGKVIVDTFLQSGEYHLNVVSREEMQANSHIKSFNVDLLDEMATTNLTQEIIGTQQHLDAAIFLTGGYISGDITQNSSTDIQKMMGLNVATAHNIVSPLLKTNRHQQKELKLIFIGAKAAMDASTSINNIAYALSKKTLFHYVSLINETEKKYGTSAFIILPGALDTLVNRGAMPDADFTKWTKPTDIAKFILRIVEGDVPESVIEF